MYMSLLLVKTKTEIIKNNSISIEEFFRETLNKHIK